jgi:periplasmic copper chaperone A
MGMQMKTFQKILAAVLFSGLCAGAALAHVSLQQKSAPNGPYRAAFGIPHGCKGSTTVTVRITIPEGIIGVKPQPKPGWEVKTVRGPYQRTYDYFHGMKLSEGVKEVVWSGGNLLNEHYDEFLLIGFVSDAFKPGDTVYFPVTQECETRSENWNEVPAEGQSSHELKSPAPALKIIAPANATSPQPENKGAHGHEHHKH